MSLARGDRLGKYEIVASLGSGGMGEVYRALDPRLERQVAIKVIRPLSSNTEAQARLWREARAAASVSHPGVCQIYDVGESDDQLFIVMELLTGQSLGARLKDGPLKPAEAVATTLGILSALGALHSRHIVHRDLKPSNVFLTGDSVKLLERLAGNARLRKPAEAGVDAVGGLAGGDDALYRGEPRAQPGHRCRIELELRLAAGNGTQLPQRQSFRADADHGRNGRFNPFARAHSIAWS